MDWDKTPRVIPVTLIDRQSKPTKKLHTGIRTHEQLRRYTRPVPDAALSQINNSKTFMVTNENRFAKTSWLCLCLTCAYI